MKVRGNISPLFSGFFVFTQVKGTEDTGISAVYVGACMDFLICYNYFILFFAFCFDF